MAQGPLDGVKVAILATDYFEQSELTEPRKALTDAGAITMVCAPKAGKIQGVKHADKAGTVDVDLTLKQAKSQDFDAVLLPGGALNADALRMDGDARKFIKEMDGAGKPIAVICHGAWLLASAGLVKQRTLTSYANIQDDLRNAGATWVDKEVVRDRNVVSSRQPGDLPAFCKEMVNVFKENLAAGKGQRPQARPPM